MIWFIITFIVGFLFVDYMIRESKAPQQNAIEESRRRRRLKEARRRKRERQRQCDRISLELPAECVDRLSGCHSQTGEHTPENQEAPSRDYPDHADDDPEDER